MSSHGGGAGDLDGQNFGLGAGSKDQRANKEALLKMTRGKRPTGAAAAPTGKTLKGKSPPPGVKSSLQRGATTEDEQFSRVKEPSDMYDTKDHLSR